MTKTGACWDCIDRLREKIRSRMDIAEKLHSLLDDVLAYAVMGDVEGYYRKLWEFLTLLHTKGGPTE